MTNDEIRAVLAPMRRKQKATILHKTKDITVEFNSLGVFVIGVLERKHGAASVYSTESLKKAVEHIGQFFVPNVGEVYQHINGNIYIVTAIANENSLRPEYPPSVVYKGENDLTWCKPLVNFLRKMKRIK